MDCFYINLDKATPRRLRLEENFARNGRGSWTLTRFPAIDAAHVDGKRIGGRLEPAEKGCFLSHRHLIETSLANEEHVFLMEDDAMFGPHTCEVVEDFLAGGTTLSWDLLFTDITVPHPDTMLTLIRLRQELSATGEVRLLDLPDLSFAGSTAYILNGKSKRKVHRLLEAAASLDVPYDLYLRQLILARKIAGFAFLPFLTTLSEFSESSQVQGTGGAGADLVWNTFRRMVWLDRDLEKEKPMLERISSQICDEESKLFGVLFSAMASRNLQLK